MDITDVVFANKHYKERLDKLSKETLQIIANDPVRALEEARKGIKQEEPEKINDVSYLQEMANVMQKLAQKALMLRI